MKTKKNLLIINATPKELENLLGELEIEEKDRMLVALEGVNAGIGRRLRTRHKNLLSLNTEPPVEALLKVQPEIYVTDTKNAAAIEKVSNAGMQVIWTLQVDLAETGGDTSLYLEAIKELLYSLWSQSGNENYKAGLYEFLENAAGYVYGFQDRINLVDMKNEKIYKIKKDEVLVSVEDEEFLEDVLD